MPVTAQRRRCRQEIPSPGSYTFISITLAAHVLGLKTAKGATRALHRAGVWPSETCWTGRRIIALYRERDVHRAFAQRAIRPPLIGRPPRIPKETP